MTLEEQILAKVRKDLSCTTLELISYFSDVEQHKVGEALDSLWVHGLLDSA